MRIWYLRLLFTVALVGNPALSYAAIEDWGRCFYSGSAERGTRFAHAETLLPGAPRPEAGLDDEARDALIRTIAFEADGETEIGKVAVAHVILNRMRLGTWGDDIKEVVMHPWQFEPWMTRRSEMENLAYDDRRYLSAALIADRVLSGELPDPTAGATHFLNPVVVRKRRGGSLPKWAEGEDGRPIGRHTFYMLGRGLVPPAESFRYLRIKVSAASC